MNFLKKIQQQPEHIRKLILWVVMVIIGLGLIILWVWISSREIKRFSKERFIQNLNFPSLKSETKNIFKTEVFSPLEKGLKKAEK